MYFGWKDCVRNNKIRSWIVPRYVFLKLFFIYLVFKPPIVKIVTNMVKIVKMVNECDDYGWDECSLLQNRKYFSLESENKQ